MSETPSPTLPGVPDTHQQRESPSSSSPLMDDDAHTDPMTNYHSLAGEERRGSLELEQHESPPRGSLEEPVLDPEGGRPQPPTQRPGMDEDDELDEEMLDQGEQVMSILKPVTLTMILVVFIVKSLERLNDYEGNAFSSIQAYEEKDTDSTSTKLGGSLLNAIIFIVLILCVTVVMLVLYKYHCYKVIYGWMIVSCTLLLGFFGGRVLFLLLDAYNIPFDYITFFYVVWNFALTGVLAIFWKAPRLCNQGYLVAVSAILAWALTELPEWTTWMVLGAVALYDIFAVLSPKGPLKALVEISQERKEPIPGLIYEATNVKLGLGDFVFYSVLCGRASLFEYATVATAFLGILAGLCLTLFLLAIYRRALPALPLSIALGIIFYFLTRVILVPFIADLGKDQIFV